MAFFVETVRDFGALGNGIADDRTAISDMQTATGRVVFDQGTYRIRSNLTISADLVVFFAGAKLSIDLGVIVYLEYKSIDAPREYIFGGIGVVKYRSPGGGAPVFPEWWNIMTHSGDVSPRLQAMSDSHSLVTEWHAQFQGGLYAIASGPVTFGRGAFLEGIASNRRVVFGIQSPYVNGDVFLTTGAACRFEGLQFEAFSGRASGAAIKDMFGESVVQDCNFAGYHGVYLGGPLSRAENIRSIGGGQTLPNSALVLLAGAGCQVSGITATLGHAEAAAVRIMGSGDQSIVRDVTAVGVSGLGVDINATGTDFLTSLIVDGVLMRDGGTVGVRIRNEGSSQIVCVSIDGVTSGPGANSTNILIKNSGSGIIHAILITGSMCRAISTGIFIDKADGNIDHILVNNCDFHLITNPTSRIIQSGSPTNVLIGADVF